MSGFIFGGPTSTRTRVEYILIINKLSKVGGSESEPSQKPRFF